MAGSVGSKVITHRDIRKQIHDLEAQLDKWHDHFDHRLDRVEAHIRKDIHVASAAEQAAIDDIGATVADIASKVGGFESVLQGYRDQIQAFVDQDVVDAADKAKLQAVVDGMDAEVLGQLAPISTALHAIDDGLQSPPSADAPLHAN